MPTASLLDKGREMLLPTLSISKHIITLRIEPKYQRFEEDLDKILLTTDRLSNLIRQSLSLHNSIQSTADTHTINAKIRHDLSTPLIAISGYSEIIMEDLELEADKQGYEALEHVLLLSQKLLNLIKELNYSDEITRLPSLKTSFSNVPEIKHESTSHHSLMSEVISSMGETENKQGSARLLVVDDKASNRDFLSRRLRKQGFSVNVAEHGQQALDMLCEQHYDLILLDIIMPELNGYQTLEALKSDGKLKDIPVIMISALDEIDSVVKCIEMGAEDYLQKPFNQIILTTKITATLERNWLRAREQEYHETLKHEQEKTERLLLNILPESIAKRLKNGENSIVDSFDEVTVLFADIVKFSEMSATMPPEKVVEKLNTIFLNFDLLTESHGLEKIKTIGDAYMLAGGMPDPHPKHVKTVANIALKMQQSIDQMNQADGGDLSIRIGIHTGSVVAGVIGKHKFSYDLWGDAVNVASRMDTHGLPGFIQISDAVYQRIKGENFVFDKREPIDVKGQGIMQTYFITGKKEA